MNDIIDSISFDTFLPSLGIQNLKDMGHYYVGKCPSGLHEDRSPSWVIYKNSGHHKCFSCGYAGSLFSLVKDLTGQSLYHKLGIDNQKLKDFYFKSALPSENKEKKRDVFIIKKELEIEGKLFNPYVKEEVVDYLIFRGITKEFVDYYKLKYSEDAKINGTKFFKRLIIPNYDDENNLIGAEGRDITRKQTPKVLYPKGNSVNNLFDHSRLKKNELLIITEGIMDFTKLFRLGYRNLTTTYGIHITDYQAHLISEFDEIILFPDGDEAGTRMIDILDEKIDKEFWVCQVPDKDPGEASEDEIKRALDNRKKAVDYFIEESGIFKKKKIRW